MVGRFTTVEKQVTIIGTTRGHHHAIATPVLWPEYFGFFQVGFLGLAESKAGKVRRNRHSKAPEPLPGWVLV